jgi:hypothetical protein
MRPSRNESIHPSQVLLAILLLAGLPGYSIAQAQEPSAPVSQALAQGDLFQSRRKFDLALDAYRKADKLSHHTSAVC